MPASHSYLGLNILKKKEEFVLHIIEVKIL